MKYIKTIFICLLVNFFILKLQAIEISLPQNRGELGTVGYVDMDAVFNKFPETKKAKKAFEKELKKLQKKVDTKKKELLKLKAHLIKLKEEETLLVCYEEDKNPDISVFGKMCLPLPGYTPKKLKEETSKQESGVLKETKVETTITKNQEYEILTPKKNIEVKIKNLEEKISAKKQELNNLTAETNSELSELETVKKQNIFAKIYKAVKETARIEAISVVVRKKDILYGKKTVDLTEKVLEKLSIS